MCVCACVTGLRFVQIVAGFGGADVCACVCACVCVCVWFPHMKDFGAGVCVCVCVCVRERVCARALVQSQLPADIHVCDLHICVPYLHI